MSIPETTAWNEVELAVDETMFTPWAEKGWLSHNGQSPEVAVCDFVSKLIRMMCPTLVIETGVGQGYMTRTIEQALCNGGHLVAFESDDEWRTHISGQPFWRHNERAILSPNQTPAAAEWSWADLSFIDSDFDVRFEEIRLWDEYAKPGAVALIHDTMDRDETSHKLVRELIQDLGMTGVFLQNPRGCFMAVQPQKEA
jgi:hypothetical protein